MNKKIKSVFLGIIPIIIMLLSIIINDMPYLDVKIKFIILFAMFTTSFTNIIYYHKLKDSFRKLLCFISFVLAIGLLIYSLLDKYDLIKYFSSVTATKELILSSGALGSFVFIFIQIAQVVFLPIPAVALMLVGIVVYGPLKTALFCIVGVLIGSYISFMVGKTFGYKFISWLFGEGKVIKYGNILQKNTKFILSIVFIFPFFPDDLFCMLAGITSMTFKEFFYISTLLRPISIIIVCLFGGGVMKPFTSTISSIIFVILSILIIILMIIFLKKNKKIKALFMNLKNKNTTL